MPNEALGAVARDGSEPSEDVVSALLKTPMPKEEEIQ